MGLPSYKPRKDPKRGKFKCSIDWNVVVVVVVVVGGGGGVRGGGGEILSELIHSSLLNINVSKSTRHGRQPCHLV